VSDTRDIVDALSRLVGSLDALLQTKTVQALVKLVEQLGIQETVKKGIEALSGMLDTLADWIGKLEQVAAVPKLLLSLEPTLNEASALAAASGSELQAIGLGALAPASDALRAALALFEKISEGARKVLEGLLPEEALGALRQGVVAMRTTLQSYCEELARPAARPTEGKA
jgi:hypothetical protein